MRCAFQFTRPAPFRRFQFRVTYFLFHLILAIVPSNPTNPESQAPNPMDLAFAGRELMMKPSYRPLRSTQSRNPRPRGPFLRNQRRQNKAFAAMIREWPYSEEEWQRVRRRSHAVLNATLQDDDVLRDAAFVELQRLLAVLRRRHGEHPVLLETEADFTSDRDEACVLYRGAGNLARELNLAIPSIGISLARLLIDRFQDPTEARQVLEACREEIQTVGDDAEQAAWSELLKQCENRVSRP